MVLGGCRSFLLLVTTVVGSYFAGGGDENRSWHVCSIGETMEKGR